MALVITIVPTQLHTRSTTKHYHSSSVQHARCLENNWTPGRTRLYMSTGRTLHYGVQIHNTAPNYVSSGPLCPSDVYWLQTKVASARSRLHISDVSTLILLLKERADDHNPTDLHGVPGPPVCHHRNPSTALREHSIALPFTHPTSRTHPQNRCARLLG
ncbi:hypothetical protein BDW22DRAFT_638121 [Trametopsis cervina]|nr:hypothetical protein BDW22DRAFT_638121 [Trametopsis cervina]